MRNMLTSFLKLVGFHIERCLYFGEYDHSEGFQIPKHILYNLVLLHEGCLETTGLSEGYLY